MKANFLDALVLKLSTHQAALEQSARETAYASLKDRTLVGEADSYLRQSDAIGQLIQNVRELVEPMTSGDVVWLCRETLEELEKMQIALRAEAELGALGAVNSRTDESTRATLFELARDSRFLHDAVVIAMKHVETVESDFLGNGLILSHTKS